jgi:hypothetical protein
MDGNIILSMKKFNAQKHLTEWFISEALAKEERLLESQLFLLCLKISDHQQHYSKQF